MTRGAHLTLGLALAGGLSACAAGAVDPAYISTWDPRTVNYLAAKGPVYTQVVGNPFKAPQVTLERSVTSAMSGANAGQPLSFSTRKDPNNTSPYRVVVIFNAAAGLGPQKLCGATAGPGKQTDGPVRVVAVLCAGDLRETSVTARLAPAPAGPDAPALAGVLRQMTRALFPSKNDNILGNCCRRRR